MNRVIQSFVRALGYMLLPRVIGMSLLPLLLMVVAALGLYWLFWDGAVAAVHAALQSWPVVSWLDGKLSVDGLAAWLALRLVAALAAVLIVVASLALVSMMMTPALTKLVAGRRFPALERRHGASLLTSIASSAGALLAALAALLLTMPLWLIPPFVLVLPPLIWGWLTYRVMSFDALADFASADERRAILRQYRWPLLVIGIVSGCLGAAPSVVWASGVVFAALFVVLAPLAIWIYTLVFAFSSLWFAHYCLNALQLLREAEPPAAAPVLPLPAASAAVTDVRYKELPHEP
ncbi:MAG: EI24 domain-containing protein [Desulfovibrionaceae bacterium]|nr:EI24 domain-containing protein [Desulfovibrionaceae bacterium]